eukprot:Pgem_evm1s10148
MQKLGTTLSDFNDRSSAGGRYNRLEYVGGLLAENNEIKISDWCNLPNGQVNFTIPNEDLQKHLSHQQTRNFVAKAHEQFCTETINGWLEKGMIEKNHESTSVNIPLLAVPQYNSKGELKKNSNLFRCSKNQQN